MSQSHMSITIPIFVKTKYLNIINFFPQRKHVLRKYSQSNMWFPFGSVDCSFLLCYFTLYFTYA